jgi:hypothetical protein
MEEIVGKGVSFLTEELTYSGNIERWASLIAEFLLRFEELGWITINRELIKNRILRPE